MQKEHRGFTLIELLTVIAIIAVLAALLFPVFGKVREGVRQTTCMTQMHDISVALKLYREDNNKYPAALYGFAQNADGSFHTGTGTPVGMDAVTYRPLTNEQKYLKDKNLFVCPDNTNPNPADVTMALYPPTAGAAFAGKPVTFTDLIQHNIINKPVPVGEKAFFYKSDSYDVGPQVDQDGNVVPDTVELHYSLDWTGVTGPDDNPNQLKYRDPPSDSTVVTWCTYHAAVAHADKLMVLMLNGTTKPVPINQFIPKGPLGFGR